MRYFLVICGLFVSMTFMSCEKESVLDMELTPVSQRPNIKPVVSGGEDSELCDYQGTVYKYSCGFVVELDNGETIYPEVGYGDFSFYDSQRVGVSFTTSWCATHGCMDYATNVEVLCISER